MYKNYAGEKLSRVVSTGKFGPTWLVFFVLLCFIITSSVGIFTFILYIYNNNNILLLFIFSLTSIIYFIFSFSNYIATRYINIFVFLLSYFLLLLSLHFYNIKYFRSQENTEQNTINIKKQSIFNINTIAFWLLPFVVTFSLYYFCCTNVVINHFIRDISVFFHQYPLLLFWIFPFMHILLLCNKRLCFFIFLLLLTLLYLSPLFFYWTTGGGDGGTILSGAIPYSDAYMHKPAIIFEISQYTLIEEGKTFEWLWHLLSSVGYKYLINIINNRLITIDNYKKELPASTTTDVIALFEMPSEI